MFKKIKTRRRFEKEQELYWSLPNEWYFDVEYHNNFSCYSHHLQFSSLKDAHYWYITTSGVYLVAVTDRQGNRIITDWTGYTGAGTIDLWNNWGRSVLYLRDNHNDLWLPSSNPRAKNAKQKKPIY